MAEDWRNRRQRPRKSVETAMVALRLPAELKTEIQQIADANDTTVAAIVRYSLERFVDDHAPAPAEDTTAALFD